MVRLTDDGGGMNLKAIRDKAHVARHDARRGQHSERRGCDAADPRAGLLHRRRHHPAGRPRRRHGRGGHRDQAPRRRAAHGDQARRRARVFTIRLPLTLAISHALVVRTDEEYLRAAAADGRGRAAPVARPRSTAHLGPRGGRRSTTAARSTASSTWRPSSGLTPSELPGQDVTIPVVLVRAGEHSTGLVADELVGSREIVVKSVGPQISGDPRHLRRHDPRRRPHRHHPGHRRAGARRVARARAGPALPREQRRPPHLRAWWWTTRSPCAA